MSVRRQIIAALSGGSRGGFVSLYDVDHATRLVDAHAAEVLTADRANALEEATPTGATVTPDFFQIGHTYRLGRRHTFRCTAVDSNPGTGEPHAIGWAYDTHTDRWRITDLTGASWNGGWVDVTEAGAR